MLHEGFLVSLVELVLVMRAVMARWMATCLILWHNHFHALTRALTYWSSSHVHVIDVHPNQKNGLITNGNLRQYLYLQSEQSQVLSCGSLPFGCGPRLGVPMTQTELQDRFGAVHILLFLHRESIFSSCGPGR